MKAALVYDVVFNIEPGTLFFKICIRNSLTNTTKSL
jgi:hypothetical protein